MNIDKLSSMLPVSQPESRGGPQKVERTDATGKAGAEGSTETRLSQGATDTAQDIDSARVEELKGAIREGRLDIRTDRIADGLIDSVQDVLKGEDTPE